MIGKRPKTPRSLWMVGNALKFIEEQISPETPADDRGVLLAVAVGFGRLVGHYHDDVTELVEAFKRAHQLERAKWRRPIGSPETGVEK